MSGCLGFYINDYIVKYAKMTMDNNKNITLENYGTRYIKESLKNVLSSIIEETNSNKDLITINSQKDIFVNYNMFNQGNTKNFVSDVAKMEFESWCEKNGRIPNKYSYVYKVADVVNTDNKFNATLNIMEKETINEYSDVGITKISNMYPVEFLMNRLVPQDEKSYILVNLDDKLSVSVVVEDKLVDFKFYDFGIKNLVDKFSEILGSYQKAYEACKQLNVYSDEGTNNDKKLEEIAEPILQEILKSVAVMVNRYRKDTEKIILCGQGIVFTNIDILFREYLNVKCEILKPDFLKDTSNVRNIAETLESTSAMALALETISPREQNLDYIKSGSKLKNKFDKFISKDKKTNDKKVKEKKEKESKDTTYIGDRTTIFVTCAGIISAIAVVAYFVFSILYSGAVEKNMNNMQNAIDYINTEESKVNSDITYISNNTSEYKKINNKVVEVVQDIEENNISKYSTYNVAAFLQNIIKIIPKNVQLQTISSDDNKNVVITAKSDNYADLGYFISAIKLSGTLDNIKILNVENSASSVVAIGGELP